MSSIASKNVALEVIETVRSGRKVNLSAIQRKHGYTRGSAKAMKGVRTKTFQGIIKAWEDKISAQQERIVEKSQNLIEKKLNGAESEKNIKIRDLAYLSDITVKNRNLLRGKSTSNVAHLIKIETEEDAKIYLKEVLN